MTWNSSDLSFVFPPGSPGFIAFPSDRDHGVTSDSRIYSALRQSVRLPIAQLDTEYSFNA
jgi:hypothetical protein